MAYDTKCKTCGVTEKGLFHQRDGSYCLECYKKLPLFEMGQRVLVTDAEYHGTKYDLGQEGQITDIQRDGEFRLYRVKVTYKTPEGVVTESMATYRQDALEEKCL